MSNDFSIPQFQDNNNPKKWQSTTWLGAIIRACFNKGEWWFRASDIANAHGINNPRQALTRLDDDEKGVISSDTPGGLQDVAVINESGLYVLTLSSRKQEAKDFKRWITHELLPSLRRQGFYISTGITPEQAVLLKQQIADLEKALYWETGKRGTGRFIDESLPRSNR